MNNILNTWTGIEEVSWIPVLENSSIRLGSQYQVVPTEGYLAWEYNPLRNYRLSKNMYEKDGKYYTWEEFTNIEKNVSQTTKDLPDGWTLREAGELVDFITDELSFNLQHPVDILPQYSYDGSVNLILNDGLNIPRLINSRFTVTGKNTYKIIDRKGDNDTNIYDQGVQFDVDTSLFKNVNKIPNLEYLGTYNGNMKIGNYHFYFKYSDADGNESDWVAESGLVSVFMGTSPQSVNTGIRDENSIKSVRFKLSNIDIGYSYVKVYYTRYSSDIDGNFVVSAKRIDKNFIVTNSGTCLIYITGDENETEVTLEEINSSFDVIQNAKTQCTAANRLFMANIHKSKIEYDILSKLSLCFCPYKHESVYPLTNDGMDHNYVIRANSQGYYDSQYIYDKTSYWPGELYRIGVVYILKDGSLSPVFNIRGATNIPVLKDKDGHINNIYAIDSNFYNNSNIDIDTLLESIKYSEEDFMIVGGEAENENAKGVIQLADAYETSDVPFYVAGIEITTHHKIIEKLKQYVKGFFFVRQKRMPLTLCQGLVIGLDKESRTPTLPTIKGVTKDINPENSYIESSNYNDLNFISEGFLSRYKYTLEKEEIGTGKKILIATAVVAILAAAVVATIFTAGAAGVAVGATIGTVLSAGGSLVAGSLVTIGIVSASVVGAAAIGFGIQGQVIRNRQKRNLEELLEVKGRHTEIPKGLYRKEQEESRQLSANIEDRYIITDPQKNTAEAIIVPDYQVNQPYYNQFLTGETFTIKLSYEQPSTNYLTDGYLPSYQRHFYVDSYLVQADNRPYTVKLVGVPDGCPIKMIGDSKYRARAGYPEEAYKYEFQGVSYDDALNKKDNSDIIRGNYGSYVGVYDYSGHAGDQVNIMIPGYKENQLFEYVQLRAQDTSAFYAISDRIDINQLNKSDSILHESATSAQNFSLICYRGDSYICQYTHRINRNFNDPSAPYNDKVVDINTWKDNYDPDKPEQYADINLGDVNAVPLGLWLTFWVRSSYNLNIRTIDKSHVDEYLMCGNYRSFYPNYGQLAVGGQKIPDSDQYNKGFSKSVSEKYYFEVPDVPYIKQEFQNRIIFSDIHINDAYKNGFRVIRTTNHKDYPMTHGSITKLIELKNTLLIVFEHGIGLVSINNQAEHSSQILSDLNIISDTYGSQWKDSIIKTPSGVYGVDTVAKKIWRVKEGQIELISDMKVQEFLNQNITLSERELTPIIGIRNVKTFYNAFKHDVMFTFYDNLYGTHEKSWNLCWNEILGIFTTFYSWIPSEMVNIDNIPFSFDRNTVKAISKLGVSDHGNDYSDGVTLSNNVLNVFIPDPIVDPNSKITIYQNSTFSIENTDLKISYLDPQGESQLYNFLEEIPENDNGYNETVTLQSITNSKHFIGFLHLDNRALPDGKVRYKIAYELLRDSQNNHRLFEIKNVKIAVDTVNELTKSNVKYIEASYLMLKLDVDPSILLSELYYRNNAGISSPDYDSNKVAPKTQLTSFNNKKLNQGNNTRIINKTTYDNLLKQYGPNWPVGHDATLTKETADHCGYLGEIEKQCTFSDTLDNDGIDRETLWLDNPIHEYWLLEASESYYIYTDKPIFKNKQGKRLMLPRDLQVNPDQLVRYLNIKANVYIEPVNQEMNATEAYYSQFANGDNNVCMIDAGYFESQVAVTTSFNLSLLSTDFWKHGQAGIMDIADKIYPTYWYGKQHPFEFECVVVDNPSVHKIFTNLELVANKVKPESFHYEVVGDVYDFAEDKPTMYFRQEALKALYQYNGYDIEYNPNFLEIEPKQHNRSADLPKYYSRWDTINDIYDSYKRFSAPMGFNYDHLSGAEIVYYPTRNEFRVWNHVEAIDADSKVMDKKKGMEVETSIIKANCRYLEDKWLVTINPIIVTYKNEVNKADAAQEGKSMFSKDDSGAYTYSTWVDGADGVLLPPILIQGTKLQEKLGNNIEFPDPDTGTGKDNALYGLYDLKPWNNGDWRPIDPTKNKDRRETDVRGKFMKVRIRYSGEELAIIDFLNTIYQISFA